ncbi:hypothetical protein R5W24_004699 [Gemmata sp. JC717]|uniref:TIGR03435 family protein n=1 Tax=Gemmata algarum TaxID=2975278 RepID=A0ABU5FAW1_9BACT|nr:hypothetical protein [Gemmata algarum]MDY3555556.1 hypothetical protein [Gemmata algarum]MDY3563835.1 hypothetical protein [Gemmata algarum]
MRVELFGLVMESPSVTFYLWSPWRCSALEHKLFDALKSLPNSSIETVGDEIRLHIVEAKGWRAAVQNLSRVLKGWQEEASDAGKDERRGWRWLLEADTDASGYDMQGEKTSFWAYIRLSIDRGGPGEAEKGEDIDLNGFGVQVWGEKE